MKRCLLFVQTVYPRRQVMDRAFQIWYAGPTLYHQRLFIDIGLLTGIDESAY